MLVMPVSLAVAGGHPQVGSFRLHLPCFTTAHWMMTVETNGFRLVDTRVDSDGDTWIIWEISSGWRSTVTINRGAVTCIVGGKSAIKPGKTHF